MIIEATISTRPNTPQWSGELVMQRMIEAFAIENRMPGAGVRRISSGWPAAPIHEFADVVAWEDASARVWERWERAKGTTSIEVSRMEEAHAWLQLIEGDERKHLQAFAARTAQHRSVRAMLEKRGISRSTFYRTIKRAAQRIANILNEKGIRVR